MKTIIHIGQHKTGTTSLQSFLQDNRAALIKDGLYVPTSLAGFDSSSHFILNVYALDENRYSSMKEMIIADKGRQYLNELEAELKKDINRIYADAKQKKCNTVIFSNEGLYLLNRETEYKRLMNLFVGCSKEIEVVCCFRDVQSYRESYIKQQAKQNFQPSDNPDSYRYLKSDSWLFDYERKKELLSSVFKKCTYFNYDSMDNVSNFMKVIDHKLTYTNDYRLNVTRS